LRVGAPVSLLIVIEPLNYIPQKLMPAGIRLPVAVSDVLASMGRMRAASVSSERHRLLQRVDSKFAMPRSNLPLLVNALSANYEVLTAAGEYAASYVTVYYDTDERKFLMDHLRGRRPRHKLRVRHYLDRKLSFLEVKTKTAGSRTEKRQKQREFGGNGLSVGEQHWAVHSTGVHDTLHPRAWTTCQRISLLRLGAPGRITIDLNVSLGTADGARTLRDLALVEVKQERTQGDPVLSQALYAAHARPVGLSKYVAAMINTSPALPRARFLSVLGRYARPEFWQECLA
jgi:hypothetical protein